MTDHQWSSRNKTDLIIEVWEKLDCESVGASEIEAIETVVREVYGENAADPPVVVARLLADEGAVLRHPEILELDVRRRLDSPYDAMFRNILRYSTFAEAERSLRDLENLRKKLSGDEDKHGLAMLRDLVIAAREDARAGAGDRRSTEKERRFYAEIAEWFAIWLQSSEIFGSWVRVRKTSPTFVQEFGSDGE
ncbi:MAG: hypothetical protein IPM63_08440 [Acidobacteriota bacterium]|nr:MAG: hypothetical protein IPM63_08440 [Acidobacteriota bacterium]